MVVNGDGRFLLETHGQSVGKKVIANHVTPTDSFVSREKQSSLVAELAGAQSNEAHKPAQEIISDGKNVTD